MVAFIGWFTGTGSSSSSGVDASGGGGSWGAFTPNVGSFASGGSGFDSFGGFGIGSDRGGSFGDSSFALDRGGGGWGAFQPTDDGFANSEPLGGYAGTTPNYDSITNLDRVTVTAPKPNPKTFKPNTVLFDPTYNPVQSPYDPTVPTLDTVTAVVPTREELAEHNDAVVRETLRRDQSRLFEYFTGPIGAIYSGIKSAFNRDWWGAGFALAGIVPIGRVFGTSRIATKYAVGPYNELKGALGLDAHHVGQKALMKDLIPGYDPSTAPAILVPKVGHTIRGPTGIVSRSTDGLTTARDVLARDVWELRRVYSDIPNAQLQQLIRANKDAYPDAFLKGGAP